MDVIEEARTVACGRMLALMEAPEVRQTLRELIDQGAGALGLNLPEDLEYNDPRVRGCVLSLLRACDNLHRAKADTSEKMVEFRNAVASVRLALFASNYDEAVAAAFDAENATS